jgi:hypothetical protein
MLALTKWLLSAARCYGTDEIRNVSGYPTPSGSIRTARRRTAYEPTREAAMAAFAKSWRRQ